MEALINESFISWANFFEVALVVGIALILSFTFHLFESFSWRKSLGYHLFFYIMMSILVIAFILVRPFYHLQLVLIIFGIFNRQIFSYARAVMNLFFSGVKLGDHISIGEAEGKLTRVNFGGLHLQSAENKIFFPFNQWRSDRLVLHTQDGKVPVSFEAVDTSGRDQNQIKYDMERLLFRFPYLYDTVIDLHQSDDKIRVSTKVSSSEYKESLLNRVVNNGFELIKEKR